LIHYRTIRTVYRPIPVNSNSYGFSGNITKMNDENLNVFNSSRLIWNEVYSSSNSLKELNGEFPIRLYPRCTRFSILLGYSESLGSPINKTSMTKITDIIHFLKLHEMYPRQVEWFI
jgi:hypothetical protein